MRLERVLIEGFGPLVKFEAALEPRRLNVLIGPNESGKSSFAAAVAATFFGGPSLEAEARAKPWAAAAHATAVVFTCGTGRYRVRRSYATQEVRVEQLDGEGDAARATLFQGVANPRGRSAELSQYEELLRGWLGFIDERLFRESCFVHESALETRVSPELRHLVSGAVEADYQQIQDALLSRLDALTREHPYDPKKQKRNPRSIELREDRIDQLRARRARSETVLTELKSRTKEREQLESNVQELRAELAGKRQLLADLDGWVALREEQRKLMKRVPAVGQELVIARRSRAQIEEIDRRIGESLGYLANTPEEVETDLLRLGMLRSQRARHQKSIEGEREKLDARPGSMGGLPLLLAPALGAAAGLGAWLGTGHAVLTGSAALAGAILGYAAGRAFSQSAVKSLTLLEARVRVVEESIKTLSQEIDQIEIRVHPYILGRTIEVVLADVKRFRAANQERREAAAILHSLPTPERLEAEAKELDEAVAALRSREKALLRQSPFLSPLKDDAIKAAEAADRLKREATALETRIGVAEEELGAAVRRPGGAEGDAENLEALDEEIAAEEAELVREKRQRDALLLALDVLRDSVHAYQQQHVGRLAEQAGATLARLTAGRYRSVTLDGDLNPLLSMNGPGGASSGGRESVPMESLSRGARDAFYLSLRAALARELAAREPLPLLLDDPVAHLDEERRGTLLAMLEELAKDVQVILLTHDRRILNQVREAHVLPIGGAQIAKDASRKVESRR